MRQHSEPSLKGLRVLVVEDEYFLADDITRSLAKLGAEVVGPAPTCEEAFAAIERVGEIDAAVLDVNLQGASVFPLADALRERNVPLVFGTGYEPSVLPEPYRDAPRWEKPFDPDALVRALPELIRG